MRQPHLPQQQLPLMLPLRQIVKQKPPLKQTYRILLRLLRLQTWQQKQQQKQQRQPLPRRILPYLLLRTWPYLQNVTLHVIVFVNVFANVFVCVCDHLIVNLNLSLYIY
jgi:hypothetical protein